LASALPWTGNGTPRRMETKPLVMSTACAPSRQKTTGQCALLLGRGATYESRLQKYEEVSMNVRGKPKATILVIDDEQIVHESVQRILVEEGYEVQGALRVEQALDLLAKGSYDLVLTDLMMPDRSGMDAIEAVARDHPHTGVVMFTGFAT